MKKQIFSAVLLSAALGFASCDKNEAGNPVGSFNAFSEASASAKTHLEPDVNQRAFNVMWDAGDQIKIYDAADHSATYSTQQGDAEAATFTATFTATDGAGVAEGSTYTAFYPASISPTTGSSVTLPAEQPYQKVEHDNNGYYGYVTGFPMAAQSTSNDLYFKNLCGLCVLRLKGPLGAVVSSITLSEPTYPYNASYALAGTFGVSWSGGLPSLSASDPVSTGGQEGVTLSGCDVTLNGNYGLFYFYLPEGDHKWLNVKVNYTLDGTTKSFSRTVLASSYSGASNISFDRSRWTALDVDLSTDMNNASGEGQGLIYAADNLTFSSNSNNEPILNTNHRITDEAQSYTILIDATPTALDGSEVGSVSRFYTLYNDMDATAPYNGIIIRYQKPCGGKPLSINADGPQASSEGKLVVHNSSESDSITVAAGTRNRIAVVVDLSTLQYHLYANSVSADGSSQSYCTHKSSAITQDNWLADDQSGYVRAVIGGDQSDVDGDQTTEVNQLKLNFQGTIHKIRIYNRVITDAERQNWFSSGSIAGSSSK